MRRPCSGTSSWCIRWRTPASSSKEPTCGVRTRRPSERLTVRTSPRRAGGVLAPTRATVVVFAIGDVPWPSVRTLALVALTALLVWTVSGHRRGWVERPGVAIAFMAALIAVLGALSAWFAGSFGFIGYVHSWRFLKGAWRYPKVITTALATVEAYVGEPLTFALGPLLLRLSFVVTIVVMVVAFSHLGEVTEQRSAEREQVAWRLRETIRENEGLHARLLVQAREAGVLDERRRIARSTRSRSRAPASVGRRDRVAAKGEVIAPP